MKQVPIAVLAGVLAFGFTAGGALAQSGCPVAADLDTGIRVDLADGSAEVHRRGAPGMVLVEGYDADVLSYRMELAQGTHLLVYETVQNGAPLPESRATYDYGLPPVDMPVPVAGGRWQSAVTASGPDGARQEAQLQAYQTAEMRDIGGCTFEVIPVVIAYDSTDQYIEGIDYLPALGIGFLVWNQSDGVMTDPVPAVALTAVK